MAASKSAGAVGPQAPGEHEEVDQIAPKALPAGTSPMRASPSVLESQNKCLLQQHVPCAPHVIDGSPVPLTFFQRYFTKPLGPDLDPEKDTATRRQFSFLSLGSLVTATAMLLLLGVVVGAVMATLDHQHKVEEWQHQNNPVRMAIRSNFPDPSIILSNGTWYAFATNNAAGVLDYKPSGKKSNASMHTANFGKANVQLATSKDFLNWNLTPLQDQPLPTTGKWTQRRFKGKLTFPAISNTWAPAVVRTDAGKYILYSTTAVGGPNPYNHASGFNITHPQPHCIGAAVSDSLQGPYEAMEKALVCPISQGGAIDPEAFRDVDGSLYLLYKVDGNNIGAGGECGNTLPGKNHKIRSTPIMLQKMKPNGLEIDGKPQEMITNEIGDGPLVEAPTMVRSHEGIYFLLFSSGCTRLPSYTTKYATSTKITGPWTRAKQPLLKTGLWGLEAPGSTGVWSDGKGGWNMAFHARVPFGDVGRVRAMFTTKLHFQGRTATLVRDNSTVHLDHHG